MVDWMYDYYQKEIERWKTQDKARPDIVRMRQMYGNSLKGGGANNLRPQRWELEQVGNRTGMMINADRALMSQAPTAMRLEQNPTPLPTPPKRSRKRKTTDR